MRRDADVLIGHVAITTRQVYETNLRYTLPGS